MPREVGCALSHKDCWSVYARCGIEVKALVRPFCRSFVGAEGSTVAHKAQKPWRFRLYWLRYTLAIRLNIVLAKLGI